MKWSAKRLLGDNFVPTKWPTTPKGVAFVMKRTSKRLLGHFFVPAKCPMPPAVALFVVSLKLRAAGGAGGITVEAQQFVSDESGAGFSALAALARVVKLRRHGQSKKGPCPGEMFGRETHRQF